MFPTLKGDPTLVNDATPAKHKLGCRFSEASTGNTYIYILNDSTTSLTAGEVVMWTNTDGYTVSKDDGTVIAGVSCSRPCGVAVGTIAAARYGYICVSSRRILVKTDGTPVTGNYVVAPDTFDGTVTVLTADNEQCVVGLVLEQTDPTDDYNFCEFWAEPSI